MSSSSPSLTPPPSSLDSFGRGSNFLLEEDFEGSLREFDSSISICLSEGIRPPSLWFCARSACHLKLGNSSAALSDAEAAIAGDPLNGSAWWRRGSALFQQEKFKEAKISLEKSLKLGATNKEIHVFIQKCDAELAATSVSPAQFKSMGAAVEAAEQQKQQNNTKPDNKTGTATATAVSSSSSPSSLPPSSSSSPPIPLAQKVRDGFHQNRDQGVITLYAKDMKLNDISCKLIQGNLIQCELKLPDSSLYKKDFHLFALAKEVKLDLTKYRLEIQFVKEIQAEWPQLEFKGENVGAVIRENELREGAKPNYPSSAKRKTSWTEVEKDVTKAEEAEKPEGEQALQKLFQTIYKDADENTKRAMIKSFQTSGGTVLSTNWDEVAKANYEEDRTAPDGQEFRDWNDPDGSKKRKQQQKSKERGESNDDHDEVHQEEEEEEEDDDESSDEEKSKM